MIFEQVNIFVGLVSIVKKESDIFPILLAFQNDIDMLLIDFRLDQEEILT